METTQIIGNAGNRYKDSNEWIDKIRNVRSQTWSGNQSINLLPIEQRVSKERDLLNSVRYNAVQLIKEYNQAESEIDSKYNSVLFPNSNSFDVNKKNLGYSQKSNSIAFTTSKQNEQSITSTIKTWIDMGEHDSLGYAYLYFSGITPKNADEARVVNPAKLLLSDYFSKTKLGEVAKEREKLKTARSNIESLKKEYGISL